MVAKAYGELKIALLRTYKYQRNHYTDKKSGFIDKYTKIAMHQYPGKYKIYLLYI